MDLVTLLQPAQDRHGVIDRRLADENRLEATFERGVFFDMFTKLIERGRADAAEFAARECRLEQIGRVHRPFGLARADDEMEFVDKKDDPSFGLSDVFQDCLESVLELAAELRAGDERAHVERDQFAIAEAFGHISRDDSLRQTFDDRRLADPRFADQYRVVFGAPGQDLNDAANLGIATDHRVHLAFTRNSTKSRPYFSSA